MVKNLFLGFVFCAQFANISASLPESPVLANGSFFNRGGASSTNSFINNRPSTSASVLELGDLLGDAEGSNSPVVSLWHADRGFSPEGIAQGWHLDDNKSLGTGSPDDLGCRSEAASAVPEASTNQRCQRPSRLEGTARALAIALHHGAFPSKL